MTEYEQKLYDVISDWWDEVFCCNPAPLDRDGEYLDKNSTIIDLVKSISDIDDWDKPIREGVDPYNLTGRDPTQSVWKNGKRHEEQALKALDKLHKENGKGMKELADDTL